LEETHDDEGFGNRGQEKEDEWMLKEGKIRRAISDMQLSSMRIGI